MSPRLLELSHSSVFKQERYYNTIFTKVYYNFLSCFPGRNTTRKFTNMKWRFEIRIQNTKKKIQSNNIGLTSCTWSYKIYSNIFKVC